MLKWLNILAIAYLAIAPGMDVGRLIHAVNLCHVADPAGHNQITAEPHDCCGHSHAPEPKPEPPQDCPHMHEVAMQTTAMPVAQLVSVVGAALPMLNMPVLEMQAPLSACRIAEDDPRPPPGPPLFGTIILLV